MADRSSKGRKGAAGKGGKGASLIAVLGDIDDEGNLMRQAAAGAGSVAEEQKAAQVADAGNTSATANQQEQVAAASDGSTGEGSADRTNAAVAAGVAEDPKPAAPEGAKEGLGAKADKPKHTAPKTVKPVDGPKPGVRKQPWAPASFVAATPEQWQGIKETTTPAANMHFTTKQSAAHAGDSFGQLGIPLAKAVCAQVSEKVGSACGEQQARRCRASWQFYDFKNGLGVYSIRVKLPSAAAESLTSALTALGKAADLVVTLDDGTQAALQLCVGNRPLYLMQLSAEDEVLLPSVAEVLRSAQNQHKVQRVHWVGQVTDEAGVMSVMSTNQEQAAAPTDAQLPPWARSRAQPGTFMALVEGGDALSRSGELVFGEPHAPGKGKTVAERGAIRFKLFRQQGAVMHPISSQSKPGARGWERERKPAPAAPAAAAAAPARPAPRKEVHTSTKPAGSTAPPADDVPSTKNQGLPAGSSSGGAKPAAAAQPATDPATHPPMDRPGGPTLVSPSPNGSTAAGAAAAGTGYMDASKKEDKPPSTPGNGLKTGGKPKTEDEGATEHTPAPGAAKRHQFAQGLATKPDTEPLAVSIGLNKFSTNKQSAIKPHMSDRVAKELVRTSLKQFAEQALASQAIMGGLPSPTDSMRVSDILTLEKQHNDMLNHMTKAVMAGLTEKGEAWKQWVLAGSLKGVMDRGTVLALMRDQVKETARAKGLEEQPPALNA